ncbi:MAG: protein-L-isoaspartate O-methyltransferase [Chromatiaceae bacterium]|jgi:protein-L-isoaspartate(D-aspartate) O-methyltransferase|nr:protein-L-isoaspartate O-methyltransferase [Chromatiaceae bacterium]
MDSTVEQARFNMIQQQIRPWEVTDDRVLEAMDAVPRERFVPDAYQGLAYADIEVPLGEGQVMLPPKLAGRLLQALAIGPEDRVLEIGTGTGYLTACLARLGARVVTVEIHPALAQQAQANLAALAIANVEVRAGDGLAGPVAGGPFAAIVVTGSLPSAEALPALQGQLAAGGRLFAVVGAGVVMQALLITRAAGGQYRREALFETSVPPLENVPQPSRFVF